MHRALVLVLVLAVFSSSAEARPRHWFTDWKWYLGAGVVISSVVADRNSTCSGFRRGLLEANPLALRSHSCGEATAVLAIGGATYIGLHAWSAHLLRDDPSRKWRTVSLVTVPAIACAFHCSAAIHNYSLQR